MCRLIAAINITADGFMARPDGNLDWHFKYWDNQLYESLCQQLIRADIILLGSRTYMAMANYWIPKLNGISVPREDLALSELLNRTKKVVVSKTITKPKWQHTTVMTGQLVDEIKLLKSKSAKSIIILGSGKLVASLAKLDLIDGYELWMHPLAIKNGLAVFDNEVELGLTNTQVLRSGVIHLSYEVR